MPLFTAVLQNLERERRGCCHKKSAMFGRERETEREREREF